jgi:cytochrome P450
VTIIANTEVWTFIGLVGQNENIFPDAATWMPERFLPGGVNADFGVTIGVNPKPGDVMPFSVGGRR